MELVRYQVFEAAARSELPYEALRALGVEPPELGFYFMMTGDHSDQHFGDLAISREFCGVGATLWKCMFEIDERKPENCRVNFDANLYDRKEMRVMLDRYLLIRSSDGVRVAWKKSLGFLHDRGIVVPRLVDIELGAARQSRIRAEVETQRAQMLRASEKLGIKEPQLEIGDDGVFVDPMEALEKTLESLSAQILPDMVTFDFVFRNDGELTIRAPLVEFRELSNRRFFDEGLVRVLKSVPSRLKQEAIIYPGDEWTIKEARFTLVCKREATLAAGDYALHWKVFLDNSPPSSGEIDLGSLIESARKEGVADH